MDVISHRPSSTSALNPNAPLFVPLAYRTVEDFSDQWWALVQSSPWFRDYWLQERFLDPQNDPPFPDMYDPALPDELDSLFFDDYMDRDYPNKQEEEEEEEEEVIEYGRDLVSLGAMKWQNGRALAKSPRHVEKAPKIVNLKVSPRTIHQPR